MATIRKRGNSYQIRVSAGYDSEYRQVIHTKTWKPTPGMTERQIEKEVARQAIMFGELCKKGIVSVNIKFKILRYAVLCKITTESAGAPPSVQEYYIKGKKEPAAPVLAALRRSGTRPAHLPPFSRSGGLPPPEGYPGGLPGRPGAGLLNPSNKIFSKKDLRGLDKIEKM